MHTNTFIKRSIFIACIFLIAACSTSKYSLREPHLYENNYNEVISAITDVLATERITVIEDEHIDDNTYRLYFYKKSKFIQEQEFEYGASASMTITKIDENKTSVQIEEKKANPMVKDNEREHLAKDIFEALEKRLQLQPKLVQK